MFALRARVVLPLSGPAIENGLVRIGGGSIVEVVEIPKRCIFSREKAEDLGDVLLFPGLINPHCHLDYTLMAGHLPRPSSFPDWIKGMLALKAGWGYSDYAASWLAGARMLCNGGVSLVADTEAVPELLPDVWSATPLRVLSLLEMTGIRARQAPEEVLARALDQIDSLPSHRDRFGLSPHAPYSAAPELLRMASQEAAARNLPLSIHVAESHEEWEMFRYRRGPMFDWLARNHRDMSDCGGGTPVQALARQRVLGPQLLAIHANYLDEQDVRLLAESNTSVVHCPRSHAYFGHERFAAEALRAAGVNICLGTDSLVTVAWDSPLPPPRLDLLEEMREFRLRHPSFSPRDVLEMATLHPARALGYEGRGGQLIPDAWADMVAIPFSGPPSNAEEAIVSHRGPVSRMMIGGRWMDIRLGESQPLSHKESA